MRKVAPLGKALRGYSAWVTGIRRVEAPTRANAPLISFDEAFELVKINPLAAWTDDDMQDYIDDQRRAGESACRRGLSVDRLRAVHGQAGRGRRPAQRPLAGLGQDRMRAARLVTRGTQLVLTAHGSADPRSAAMHAVAGRIRACGPASTFGWRSASRSAEPGPGARRRVRGRGAQHQGTQGKGTQGARHRHPIAAGQRLPRPRRHPASIAGSANPERVWRGAVLGEDPRLVTVLRQRVADLGVSRVDDTLGVLVVAVGSSDPAANARTARVRRHWRAPMGRCDNGLRHRTATVSGRGSRQVAPPRRPPGGDRAVVLGTGTITDRVRASPPRRHSDGGAVGAHRLVAATVLDRFDQALKARPELAAA